MFSDAADAEEVETFRAAIEALPLQEAPEVFGLHANADLTFRALQVAEAVAVVEGTQPKGGAAAGGGAQEDKVEKTCQGLLAKLPPAFKGKYKEIILQSY